MDKLENYRTYIKQLLTNYVSLSSSDGEARTELIFDTERDHYQVVHTGWKNRKPMYGCVLHLAIKGENIWIHHD